jgi:GT2 family glycosyltransferase
MTANNNLPLVSIVIPTHNRKKKIVRLLNSILNSTYDLNRIEITVVDDASTDGTYQKINKDFTSLNLRLIHCNEEKLTAECRNIGLDNSEGKYVFFIDDDAILDPTTICLLVNFMEKNETVGISGPIILYWNNPEIIWCAGIKENLWTTLGRFIGKNKKYEEFRNPIICDAIPTAFMVRRSVITNCRFNSVLFPIQFEEIDFCIRVNRSGYVVCVVPWARIWHERPTATALRNPLRTYFEVRNRFLRHKLWSRNTAQYVSSGFFALFIPLIYLLISIFFTSDFLKTSKSIFNGLVDGMKLSFSIDGSIKCVEAYSKKSLVKLKSV